MNKLLIIVLTFLSLGVFAQKNPDVEQEDQPICVQNLRTARTLYDEGKLNEIPKTVNSCLVNGFSSDEKVEAYRLLAITYLYLDEPLKADEAMLNLLRVDPEYVVSEELDPAEYINLYRSFRTTWLFRAGFKLGGVYSIPHVTTFYGMAQPGEYVRGLGFQIGLFTEFNVTDQIKLQPELFFTSRNYSYSNNNYITGEVTKDNPGTADGSVNFVRTLGYLELFVAGKYKIWDSENYYLTLAPGVGYLLSGEQDETELVRNIITAKETKIILTDIDIDLLNKINPQLLIGGGTEFKFNRLYLTLDLRYGYSFRNLIVDENRYNLEIGGGYFTDSDHKLHTFSFTIGLMQAIYNPKKLIE